MTYRIYYGDVVAVASRDVHLDERVRSEGFSTEYEALRRARELLEQDAGTAVAIFRRIGEQVCHHLNEAGFVPRDR